MARLPYTANPYKQRNLMERRFERLKAWRRVSTHCDRCAHTFMSAICIEAMVKYWF